MDGGRLVMLG